MDQPQTQAVDRQVMRLGDDRRAQLGLVERAEPLVVIAGHDRQRAPPAPEFGQGLQALASQQIVVGAPRAHPEVAEVAGDHQGIVARQSAQPGAEAAVAIGTIDSQVNIAGEVVRHGRNVLAVRYILVRVRRTRDRSDARVPRCRPDRFLARGVARCRRRACRAAGPAAAGADPEVGKGRALPRGMDLGVPPRGTGSRRRAAWIASSG